MKSRHKLTSERDVWASKTLRISTPYCHRGFSALPAIQYHHPSLFLSFTLSISQRPLLSHTQTNTIPSQNQSLSPFNSLYMTLFQPASYATPLAALSAVPPSAEATDPYPSPTPTTTTLIPNRSSKSFQKLTDTTNKWSAALFSSFERLSIGNWNREFDRAERLVSLVEREKEVGVWLAYIGRHGLVGRQRNDSLLNWILKLWALSFWSCNGNWG